ncbi:MAG TPA: aldehyde reductase [Caulobacteraceae bacterium]|nr:aldehyde reductase [Caulobacteraceae bacterium]
MARVLVTGGSGFIGAHCLLQLLAAGHEVAATVRSVKKREAVLAMLRQGGAADPQVALFEADLDRDAGWAEAVAGCDYVLHVASPFPPQAPRDENDLIRPARDGALRVLRAARDAGIKRVVLTSSFAAVGYGAPPRPAPFTEADWTDAAAPGVHAYVKSKTIAERAAWDFIAREGGALELSVVNPVAVYGPVLGPQTSTSIIVVKRMLDGTMPGCPKLYFGVVDVRDVADLHLRCMTDPAAKGERFLAVAGDFLPVIAIARALRAALGPAASKAPTFEIPDWLVRAIALVNPPVRQITPELGKRKNATSDKARRVLGWSPYSADEAVVATARSLIELGRPALPPSSF